MGKESSKQNMKPKWDTLPDHSYERYCEFCRQEHSGLPIELIQWYGVASDNIDPYKIWPAANPPLTAPAKPTPAPNVRPKTSAEYRADFLEAVKGMVCKDRSATHGDAEDNFQDIADFINTYLGKRLAPGQQLQAYDVAAIMILVKVSRMKSTPKYPDHWHDAAGYAACGGGIIQKTLDNQED